MKKYLVLPVLLLSNILVQAEGINLSCFPEKPSCTNCPEYQTLFPVEKFSKNNDALDIEANESQILQDKYLLSGNVEVNSENLFLSADNVEVLTLDNEILAEGNVRFQDESYLIKSDLLNLAPLGVIGYHPAALPANRGRHPLIWALILGLKETASTFFFMDEGVDSGDIVSQYQIKISENDNAGTLYKRITETALEQIDEFVPRLSSDNYQRIPQDHSQANYWRKRGKKDGQIDWRMSATSIYNLVRGLTKPYIGAHFELDGEIIKVWKTTVVENNKKNIEPGKVLTVDESGTVVKTGENSVRLEKTDPVLEIRIGSYL